MTKRLTEQLPVRLSDDQREFLRDRVKHFKHMGAPGRVTEGDIIRSLINTAMNDLAIAGSAHLSSLTAEANK